MNKRKRVLSTSQGVNSKEDTEDISGINGELKQLKRMMAKIYSLQKRSSVKEVFSINGTMDVMLDKSIDRQKVVLLHRPSLSSGKL